LRKHFPLAQKYHAKEAREAKKQRAAVSFGNLRGPTAMFGAMRTIMPPERLHEKVAEVARLPAM
jgi:hypothetical protein